MADILEGLENFWNSITGTTGKEAAEKERQAQEAKIAQMRQAAQVYAGYRPQAQQARMNALSNISTAYQPANNALATMYGGTAQNSAYQARPEGYKPITAGGAQAQQSYRPLPQVQPGQIQATDPRNPPGSTIPITRPSAQPQAPLTSARPQPEPAPKPVAAPPPPSALAAAKAPANNIPIARPSQGQIAKVIALAQKPSSGATRTLSGSSPKPLSLSPSITAGAIRSSGATTRPGGDTLPSGGPSVPQGLPRSETPIVGGLPGYTDPTGAIGSTGSGNNPALGLAPGPRATGSNPNVGPNGVSFQPGQMLMNPFGGGQIPANLLSMPMTIPPGSPLATGTTRPGGLRPVPPAEQVKAALQSGTAENPTGKYTTPMQSREQIMAKLSTILGRR